MAASTAMPNPPISMHTIPNIRYRPHFHLATVARKLLPRIRMVGGGLLSLAGLACGSDTTGLAPQDLTTAYWSLRLNHHAITMALQAPYDTVQLSATPFTVAGTVVPGTDSVSYSTPDTTVTVDALGRLTARSATLGQPATVVASLTVKGVTLVDTAFVQVDSFPLAHPVASFSIHPQGTTCHQSEFDQSFTLPVYATDAVGNTLRDGSVNNVIVYYTSSNPTAATINRNTGVVFGHGPGTVQFMATALIDGIAHQDTLAYILDPRRWDTVMVNVQRGAGGGSSTLTFTPATVTVGAGHVVEFVNPTQDTVDVVFADPRGRNDIIVARYNSYDPNTGDPIGPLYPGHTEELFFDAGTYDYHSNRYGQSGTIHVQCGYITGG